MKIRTVRESPLATTLSNKLSLMKPLISKLFNGLKISLLFDFMNHSFPTIGDD